MESFGWLNGAMDIALPLQQHPLYLDAVAAIGGDAARIEVPGAAPVGLVRRRIGPLGTVALASRGPVWHACLTDRQAEALRGLRAAGLRIVTSEGGDEAALRRAGFRQILTPAHFAEWDLTGDAAARRAAMKGKWRNRLARAEEAGLTIRSDSWRGLPHWLLDADAAQQRDRHYRALPRVLLAAMARTRGAARVFEARHRGAIVAGLLVLRHGPVATYQTAWTGPEGRRLNAHSLLLARAADWLARHGHVRLDLGPVETERNPGLARFKLGTGARLRRGGGTWLAIPLL
ncbi:MAG: putative protein involved in methicillin resistance [Rhodobacteraceae bacterium HLUCCA08]|nr:MAG: putative protein involved in methicillin resistance [Rhodobacteraceae bacterium HLUCCA08]